MYFSKSAIPLQHIINAPLVVRVVHTFCFATGYHTRFDIRIKIIILSPTITYIESSLPSESERKSQLSIHAWVEGLCSIIFIIYWTIQQRIGNAVVIPRSNFDTSISFINITKRTGCLSRTRICFNIIRTFMNELRIQTDIQPFCNLSIQIHTWSWSTELIAYNNTVIIGIS